MHCRRHLVQLVVRILQQIISVVAELVGGYAGSNFNRDIRALRGFVLGEGASSIKTPVSLLLRLKNWDEVVSVVNAEISLQRHLVFFNLLDHNSLSFYFRLAILALRITRSHKP